MQRDIQIRFPSDLSGALAAALAETNAHHEPVVFGLATSASTASRDLALVRQLVIPPETAFVRTTGHGAQWSGAFNVELMNRCAEGSFGLIILHRHAGKRVRLSEDDRRSATQLIPYFRGVTPERFHGSIVIGDENVAGMIWSPRETDPTEKFEARFLEARIRTYSGSRRHELDVARLRHLPLGGDTLTKALLAVTKVAIVGLSGGGSQLAPQLAALGFGRIVAIDPQRFDSENRFSTDLPFERDLALRRFKVAVVKRLVSRINPHCTFRAIKAEVPSKSAVEALRDVDIVVGCVNNLQARADILEIAGRYGIPYVDIGFAMGVDDSVAEGMQLKSLAGNVFTVMPGGPCMWCSGFLTKEKLAKELGAPDRSYVKQRGSNGASEHAAMVVSFNGLLASSAVTEILQLVLGFNPGRTASLYRKYDGFTGEMYNWDLKKNPSCYHCTNIVNAGDPVWS